MGKEEERLIAREVLEVGLDFFLKVFRRRIVECALAMGAVVACGEERCSFQHSLDCSSLRNHAEWLLAAHLLCT